MGKEASVKDKHKDSAPGGQDKSKEKSSNKKTRTNKKEPPTQPIVSDKGLVKPGKIPAVAGISSDTLVVTYADLGSDTQAPRSDTCDVWPDMLPRNDMERVGDEKS